MQCGGEESQRSLHLGDGPGGLGARVAMSLTQQEFRVVACHRPNFPRAAPGSRNLRLPRAGAAPGPDMPPGQARSPQTNGVAAREHITQCQRALSRNQGAFACIPKTERISAQPPKSCQSLRSQSGVHSPTPPQNTSVCEHSYAVRSTRAQLSTHLRKLGDCESLCLRACRVCAASK